MEQISGPSKLKRVAAANGAFVIVENLGHGAGITELTASQIIVSQNNGRDFRDRATNEYTFTAFSLEADGVGTYQLRLVQTPSPVQDPTDLPENADTGLVLGVLPYEDGRAGLVPRLNARKEPMPGSQLFLRRPYNGKFTDIIIENAIGGLYLRGGDYYFAKNKGDVFEMHKILDMYGPAMTTTIEFVHHPNIMGTVVIVPMGVRGEEFETQKAPFVAEPWGPLLEMIQEQKPTLPMPIDHKSRAQLEMESSDSTSVLLLAGSVAILAVCGAAAVTKRRKKRHHR